MNNIAFISNEIEALQIELKNHKLYNSLNNIDALKVFMEHHVFAVWDFMSLVKALEKQLKNHKLPWIPNKNRNLLKPLNDIIASEEYDLDEQGNCKSHFEMYLEAMEEVGAKTYEILNLIHHTKDIYDIDNALDSSNIELEASYFTRFTFSIIKSKKPHLIAAVFAFGRESIIPEMFIKILQKVDPHNTKYKKFSYYLKRHIELDGDEHGNMALEIASKLIGDDKRKLTEASKVAKIALRYRTLLWDGINRIIEKEENLNNTVILSKA